jgi:hypothetical protein
MTELYSNVEINFHQQTEISSATSHGLHIGLVLQAWRYSPTSSDREGWSGRREATAQMGVGIKRAGYVALLATNLRGKQVLCGPKVADDQGTALGSIPIMLGVQRARAADTGR